MAGSDTSISDYRPITRTQKTMTESIATPTVNDEIWFPLYRKEAKWLLDWIEPLVDTEMREHIVNILRRQMGLSTIAGTFAPRTPPPNVSTSTATDLVQSVIATALFNYTFGGTSDPTLIDMHASFCIEQAEAILAALAAQGLSIAGPGMVVVSRERMVGTLGDAIDEWIATDDGDDLMVYLTRWLDAALSGTTEDAT